MIHKVSSMSWGNIDDMKNNTEETERLNNKLMEMLAFNCGKTVKQLNRLLKDKRELYLSAEEALNFGVIDKIGFPRLVEKTEYRLVL